MRWSDFYAAQLPGSIPGDGPVDPDWVITDVSKPHFATIRKQIGSLWDAGHTLDLHSLGLLHLDVFAFRRILAQAFCGQAARRSLARRLSTLDLGCLGARRRKDLRLTPRDYVAIQVRRGDKIESYDVVNAAGRRVPAAPEGELTPMSAYLELVRQHAPQANTVFVMSDDYRAVEEFQNLAPDLRVATRCQARARGHRTTGFNRRLVGARLRDIDLLLEEVRIAAQSAFFLGPYKSNVSRFVANIHWRPTHCLCVDSMKTWTPL